MSELCAPASLSLPSAFLHRRLFGARITPLARRELAEAIASAPVPAGAGVRLLVTMNLDHVVRLQSSPSFRAAYDSAWAVTLDGAPVAAYARLKGLKAPRVTGSDLLSELIERFDPTLRRLFFVVSRPETGESLTRLLEQRGFPSGAVAWASPPFGFETAAGQSADLARAIADHHPTDLVFGLGAPKSEVWIDQHRGELGDLYAYGFGSGCDFLVGQAKRAPAAMQRLGLEWAWRVGSDPKRLWRRYFIDSWAFLPAVARDLLGRELRP